MAKRQKSNIKNGEVIRPSKWEEFKAFLCINLKEFKDKFKSKGWKVAGIGIASAGVAVTAMGCVVNEKPPIVEHVEVDVNDVTSLSEIYSLLGTNFVLSEKIEDAVKATYGEDSIVSISSENNDGSGKIAVVVDKNGLKIESTEISLSAEDFDAKKYENGTFALNDDNLTFYQDGEEQTVSLEGKFYYTDALGDLYVVDTNKVDQKILSAFENTSVEELQVKSSISESELEIFNLLLGNIIDSNKTVFYPTVNDITYDKANDRTKVNLSYAIDNYTIENCEFVFEGNLMANGTFDKEIAQNQFNNESVKFSSSTNDFSKYEGYNILVSGEKTKEYVVNVIEKEVEKTINFENWNEVFEIDGVKEKIIEILQDTLLTDARIKDMFGNSMSKEDLTSSSKKIEIFKWAFDVEGDKINGVQILGVRKGMLGDDNKVRLQGATFTFSEPINISQMQAKTNGEIDENVVQFEKDGTNYSIDLTIFFQFSANAGYNRNIKGLEPQKCLTEEQVNIFDKVMPLAVEQGLVQEGDYNFVMLLQGGDSENNKNILTIAIKFVNIKNNTYKHLSFRFVNEHNDNNVDTIIEKAKLTGNYRCEIIEEYSFIEKRNEDIEISLPTDATQTYTVKLNETEKF